MKRLKKGRPQREDPEVEWVDEMVVLALVFLVAVTLVDWCL